MATRKKTAKPQAVTFYRHSVCWRPASITNEAGTIARELESIAIYDEAGVICKLDSCDLGDRLKDGNELEITIPIIWKTHKAPDYTEARAHIVGREFYGERRYTLFIPSETVSMNPCGGYSVSKSAGYVRRFFVVDGFPVKFETWSHHPFNEYELIHELEALQKDQYRIFTGRDITTTYARERIAEFFAKIEEYTAEAERIESLSEDDYILECGALNPRFTWEEGCYKQTNAAMKEA